MDTGELPAVKVDALLDAAQTAALEAGKLLLEMRTRPLAVAYKGPRDLVTNADRAAQDQIAGYLAQRFPDHGFLPEEESKGLPAGGQLIWIIDPVDGTTNYSRLQPNFTVSVAVWRSRTSSALGEQPSLSSYEAVAGAVYDPPRNELFSAAAGQGSFLNGKSMRASDTSDLGSAVLSLDWSRNPKQRQEALDVLRGLAHKVHTIRALGSAALALVWVAAGRLDAYFNLSLGPWDAAAACLIIREAGGTITDLQGDGWFLSYGGCVASNGLIHQHVVAKTNVGDG